MWSFVSQHLRTFSVQILIFRSSLSQITVFLRLKMWSRINARSYIITNFSNQVEFGFINIFWLSLKASKIEKYVIYSRSLAVNQPRLQQPQPRIKEYKAASPSQLCMFQSQFLSSFQLLVLPTLVENCHFSLVPFLGVFFFFKKFLKV